MKINEISNKHFNMWPEYYGWGDCDHEYACNHDHHAQM